MAHSVAIAHPSSDCGNEHEPEESLRHTIEHAAHLLPSQGPISVFVHHNTLHAFEDLPFAEALGRGQEVYDCQTYLSEDRYRAELARGRIREKDLSAVLQEELGTLGDELIRPMGMRFNLRLAMLQHTLHSAPSAELRWVVAETDALRKFRADIPDEKRRRIVESTRHWIMRDFRNGASQPHDRSSSPALSKAIHEVLEASDRFRIEEWSEAKWEAICLQILWRMCSMGAASVGPTAQAEVEPRRHRDALLTATGADSDELVHPVLIRFCAAFLDQGFAHWPLPDRSRGFLQSFIDIYGEPGGVTSRWMRGMREELRRLKGGAITPLKCIEESLETLGVDLERRQTFIEATLLALRGWAGMTWQMETNAEWTVHPAPGGTLIEFLAVRLLLDRFAVAQVAREELGFDGPLSKVCEAATRRRPNSPVAGMPQRSFMFFQLAQVMGLRPEDLRGLPADAWVRLAEELEAFSHYERRRIFQLAYERRYRIETLDAINAHCQRRLKGVGRSWPQPPDFQVICCIDEREESFRRHLEELYPRCETFAYAGFFGVAMYYRGATDAHHKPLCPVVIKPQHYVEERPVYTLEEEHRRRAKLRRVLGAALHRVHLNSRSLLGGAVTALLGSLASIPLVCRVLFPRMTPRIRRALGAFMEAPSVTELVLERSEPEPGPEEGHIGYTLDEMATIVERALRDIGMMSGLASLVIFCGHGSSSLNNPHESAHDCGACGGGRGGPNARAFALMANDPRVRERLASKGLELPSDVIFIGAYNNTCDDSITYYDLDRLPVSRREGFERARAALDAARQHNAHERCRRFESASLALTPEMALRHVEARAEDLAQVRPEYGHATNAVCIVGRRSRTRGMFLDRRSFLASYDPTQDDENSAILTRILGAVIPVCAGINLEYYFSYTDPTGWGCGTKLPHNITSLLGVMDGAASDLRSGLPWQMVEVHEPVRILFVIETSSEKMKAILDRNPPLAALVYNDWVQLATLDPGSPKIELYRNGKFERYSPESGRLPEIAHSADWYRGWRDHLGYAEVVGEEAAAPGGGAKKKRRSPA